MSTKLKSQDKNNTNSKTSDAKKDCSDVFFGTLITTDVIELASTGWIRSSFKAWVRFLYKEYNELNNFTSQVKVAS